MPTFAQAQPLRRYTGNPILSPSGNGWESRALYNPSAWTDGEKIYLFYRAEGPTASPGREFTSRLGLAISTDGVNFERMEAPILEPSEAYETPGGCEDPRVVKIADTFYMTYTAFDGKVARLAMATSQNLREWKKTGLVFSDEQWEQHFPREVFPAVPYGWFKSGAILDEPIEGRYWMYFGDTNIWAAHSVDLSHWEIIKEPVLSPRSSHFDARLVEPGPPPLMTSEGIWLGYNSADHNLRYAFGQALFAANDPTQLLKRSETPLLEPETEGELVGQVNEVVFVEGYVRFKGVDYFYYGMADSRLGVAIQP